MNFLDDGIDDEEYEFINKTILFGNIMNMSLVISKFNYGAIDAAYTSCKDCYIIIFSSSPYRLQEDLNINWEVISSGDMVCEGNYFPW